MIIPQISYFDLVNLYHEAKYYKTEHPMYGYEIEKGKFVKITDTKFERMKSGEIKIIPFIDAYEVCSKTIEEYLTMPYMKNYSAQIRRAMREARSHRIEEFLSCVNRIDGGSRFRAFEEQCLQKELVVWKQKERVEVTEWGIY